MPNKNTCQCPNPPGGIAICEPHQLAICKVQGGVAQTECRDLPSDLAGLALQNWALEEITVAPRSSVQLLSQADTQILARGHYHDPTKGMTVRFSLSCPREPVDLLIRRLRDLSKSYKKMLRATPGPQIADRKADMAFHAVLDSLSDPNVGTIFEFLIPDARQGILTSAESPYQELGEHKRELLVIKRRLSDAAGMRHMDARLLRQQYSKLIHRREKPVSTTAELKQELLKAHGEIRSRVDSSRSLPRREKKKSKRVAAQSVASLVVGTAMILAKPQLSEPFGIKVTVG